MLGRGLESLIPNKGEPGNNSQGSSGEKKVYGDTRPKEENRQMRHEDKRSGDSIFHIEVDKIKPNPLQPRKTFDEDSLEELAASIREHGVIQPLIVSKVMKDTDYGTQVEYQLIAGERRLKAAKKAGLERVPAIVRAVAQEKDRLEVAIVENVQRKDLNPIEAARSYARLQEEFGLTQREVASRVGKSRETVANVLRLLNLPTYIQDAISGKQLSDSQGRLLLAINDPAQQKHLFEEIVNNNISVRELKARIASLNRPQSYQPVSSENKVLVRDPETVFVEEKLQEVLGTKVSLQKNSQGGKITISFFSEEELRNLMDKLLHANDDFQEATEQNDIQQI